MKSPRKYTATEKQAAIARTREVGPAAASKELGIPSGTLSCWAHKARQGVPGYAPPAPPPEPQAVASPEPEAAPRSGALAVRMDPITQPQFPAYEHCYRTARASVDRAGVYRRTGPK